MRVSPEAFRWLRQNWPALAGASMLASMGGNGNASGGTSANGGNGTQGAVVITYTIANVVRNDAVFIG